MLPEYLEEFLAPAVEAVVSRASAISMHMPKLKVRKTAAVFQNFELFQDTNSVLPLGIKNLDLLIITRTS